MKKFVGILVAIVIFILVVYCIMFLVGTFSANKISDSDPSLVAEGSSDKVGISRSDRPTVALADAAKTIKDEYQQDPEFQECANDVVTSCLNRVISQKITQTGDLTLCQDFLTEDAREGCVAAQTYQLARSTKDASLCDSLKGTLQRNCAREVAVLVAVEQRDISSCDVFEDEKDRCVENAAQRIARETLDVTWCDRIAQESIASACRQDIIREVEDRTRQERRDEERAQQVQVDIQPQPETVNVIEDPEETQELVELQEVVPVPQAQIADDIAQELAPSSEQ